MNTHEESLQKQIEEGKNPAGVDADAYRLVFSALKKEHFNLSGDFAQRVAGKAYSDSKKTDWDKFFLYSGLIAFGIAMVYAIAITGFTVSSGAFQFVSNYPAFIAFGTAFIFILHVIDRKLISDRQAG